jgi:hypothetical protein
MKCGILTLRGILAGGEVRRAALFNGSFTKNFKVVDLQLFRDDVMVNLDSNIVMSTQPGQQATADASDSAQIGWGFIDAMATGYSFIDPDHIIVDDLYISANTAMPGNVNYVITLERHVTKESETLLALIKENQQS